MPSNRLFARLQCPHCHYEGVVEVEAEIDGSGYTKDYNVGDFIVWPPGVKPFSGKKVIDGYVDCERCHLDYFVKVEVCDGKVSNVAVNSAKPGYKKISE